MTGILFRDTLSYLSTAGCTCVTRSISHHFETIMQPSLDTASVTLAGTSFFSQLPTYLGTWSSHPCNSWTLSLQQRVRFRTSRKRHILYFYYKHTIGEGWYSCAYLLCAVPWLKSTDKGYAQGTVMLSNPHCRPQSPNKNLNFINPA